MLIGCYGGEGRAVHDLVADVGVLTFSISNVGCEISLVLCVLRKEMHHTPRLET